MSLLRIIPSALRAQSLFNGYKNSLGGSEQCLETLNQLNNLMEYPSLNFQSSSMNLSYAHNPVSLKIEDVSFKFADSGRNLFENLNFEIRPSDFMAIVGISGSGKSTFSDLLSGFIVPSSGKILIDGELAQTYRMNNPGKISYVPQKVPILDGTIKENIALGDPFPDEVDINIALEKGRLLAFVNELPLGINTKIGSNGMLLSGGQMQRLGIARALYTKPGLIILDEPTSALDIETEKEVVETLEFLRADCTLIVIAHRFTTIRNCSSILFLSENSAEFIDRQSENWNIMERLLENEQN